MAVCRGKRDAYTLVCVCTDPFTVKERGRSEWYRGNYCCERNTSLRVHSSTSLWEGTLSFARPNIRAFERHNSRCCVHGGTIIAGRILRNPACGNCRRQITFPQFCLRLLGIPRNVRAVRNKWKLSKWRQARIVISRLRNMTRLKNARAILDRRRTKIEENQSGTTDF